MLESAAGFWSVSNEQLLYNCAKNLFPMEMPGRDLRLEQCEIWGKEVVFLLPVIFRALCKSVRTFYKEDNHYPLSLQIHSQTVIGYVLGRK